MDELYTDGFTTGRNPSRIGGGYLVYSLKDGIVADKRILKEGFTCNEAEIEGIKRATELIDSHGTIYTDSFCAMRWALNGKSKARKDLGELLRIVRENIKAKHLEIIQVPRDNNYAGIILEDRGQ